MKRKRKGGTKRQRKVERQKKKNIKLVDWDMSYLTYRRLNKSIQTRHGVPGQNVSTFPSDPIA